MSTVTTQASAHAATLALNGAIVSISADGANAAVKVTSRVGGRVCSSAWVWQMANNRKAQIGTTACRAKDSTDESFDSLTIAGNRVAWADYDYGNNGYCTGLFTATLVHSKPTDLGLCDGTEANTYYDFAGSGPLLVTREYLQCELDCAPDYSSTYQTDIALYQITDTVTKIGPLKRNTQLEAVHAGRLLLANGKTLEVVTPNQGATAVYITGQKTFGEAFISGNDVVGVAGTAITRYDAATGQQTLTRSLPAGAKTVGFGHGLVLYTAGKDVHVLRLTDGRDRTVATVSGLVAAKLDSSGLVYGYDVGDGGSKVGRLAYVPFSSLAHLLGG